MSEYPEPVFDESDPTPSKSGVTIELTKRTAIFAAVGIVLVGVGFGSFISLRGPEDAATTGGPDVRMTETIARADAALPTADVDRDPTLEPAPVLPTSQQMQQFVADMYRMLPEDTDGAWQKFDSHYMERTGKLDYENFWSTIRSLTVDSVGPRDESSVVVQLTYVTESGLVDTEERWVQVVQREGSLRVFDSERIAAT